ncbi:hypothetical protein SAMN05444581_102150 [Methylocapsa palsarum]|uniref:Uncharacterized protein n=2 Tax=Methylocapsa palsarum TaxID=1612308 RepID=A0A1I3WU69_9HYPH|nr:hypothetical protein SAMN05444581_102150 [Methylocapsa palsarum]
MEDTAEFMLIRAVLIRDWEPIVCNELLPDGEYDSYIPRILHLLCSDCSSEKLAAYLAHVERDYMEVGTDAERTDRVATNLLAAWKQRTN